MPLSAAYPILEKDIEAAYLKLLQAAQADGDNATDVMKELAKDLAAAIHAYTMAAQVVTSTSGVVTGTAAPLAPTGAAPVFGASVGAGTGNLV